MLKAEILANTFSQANKLTINYKKSIDNLMNSRVSDFKSESICLQSVNYTTFNEISNIISTLKVSESPGLDNVPNLLLKKLPAKALKLQ